MNNIFDYGAVVKISEAFQDSDFAGRSGSIAGIYAVESDRVAKLRKCNVSDVYYLVELGNGESREILGQFLSESEPTSQP